MSTIIEPVNCITHNNLRVVPSFTFDHAMSSQFMPLNASEFGFASTCYPIFFIKDNVTARFFAAALFGIDEDENLFYSAKQWNATYIPKLMCTAPFSMGAFDGNDSKKGWTVCIDRTSTYLSQEEGELLFENGRETAFLKRARDSLADLHRERVASLAFIDRLLKLALIKPVQLNIEYENGKRRVIGGLYSIKGDELPELPAEQVLEFHENGYLPAIYAALHSQHKMYDLMRLKRAKGGDLLVALQIVDRG